MRLVEHCKRLGYTTLGASLTIVDPKVYTTPWTTTGKATFRPGTELWEYFCVPSESAEFSDRLTRPAAGAK